MTDETARTDRHPTDEPDGTHATAASLRPPGESVTAPQDGPAGDDFGTDDDSGTVPRRVGYDPDDVSGDDAERYRPQS